MENLFGGWGGLYSDRKIDSGSYERGDDPLKGKC